MEQLMPVALYKPHFRVPVESFNTHPLLHQEDASGRWERTSTIYCRVCVSYGRNVFIAGVAVQPDGNFNNFAGRALYPSDLPIESVSCDAQFRFMLRTDGF
jgi:hypothetical protein